MKTLYVLNGGTSPLWVEVAKGRKAIPAGTALENILDDVPGREYAVFILPGGALALRHRDNQPAVDSFCLKNASGQSWHYEWDPEAPPDEIPLTNELLQIPLGAAGDIAIAVDVSQRYIKRFDPAYLKAEYVRSGVRVE